MSLQNLIEKFGRTFSAGEIVFREGDHADDMYIIQSGKVKITKKAGKIEKSLSILSDGEFFGEMAVVNHKPRSATAVVITPSLILVVHSRAFEAMITGNIQFTVKLVHKLCERLRLADLQIEELLIQDKKSRIVSQLLKISKLSGNYSPQGVQLILPDVIREVSQSVGVEEEEVREIFRRLEKAQIIRTSENFLFLLNQEELEKFKNFLEMREKVSSGQNPA